jgi:hypothetical protein
MGLDFDLKRTNMYVDVQLIFDFDLHTPCESTKFDLQLIYPPTADLYMNINIGNHMQPNMPMYIDKHMQHNMY